MKPMVRSLLFAAMFALPVAAQNYPVKPVLVISPVQAGSAGDTTLRLVTQVISRNLGQQLLVENTVGAAGIIGAQRLARAAPDGYTIGGISDSTLTYVPILQKRNDFDALNLFEPISLVSVNTWVLVAHPSLPVRRVRELVALAKGQSRRMDYASAGVGGSHHVVTEMFNAATGIKLNHVPYRGAAPAVTDAVAGRIEILMADVPAILSQIRGGTLRPLGISAPQRLDILPDLPTLVEAGLPGMISDTSYGLVAPAGTPPERITLLRNAMVAAINDPETRQAFAAQGGTLVGSTPDEFTQAIREGSARWGQVVRAGNIKLE